MYNAVGISFAKIKIYMELIMFRIGNYVFVNWKLYITFYMKMVEWFIFVLFFI